jgi:hypothetical protein
MAIQSVALVTESNKVSSSDLMKVSSALQKQATRDLAPIWEVNASVDPFDKLEDVPDGVWPMIIMDDIGFPGAAGIHLDRDGQPFALITAATELDRWALTASHEMCEMLVDPFGKKQVTGDSPKPGQDRVSFLVEVCDPSEAADFAYSVNGILVSDFYTPHFFDPVKAEGVRYSFTGHITAPRKVLRGGYLSWTDPVSNHLWQEMFPINQPSSDFIDRGPVPADLASLRLYVDTLTAAFTAEALDRGRLRAVAAGMPIAGSDASSRANADAWRAQIKEIIGKGKGKPSGKTKPAGRTKRRR